MEGVISMSRIMLKYISDGLYIVNATLTEYSRFVYVIPMQCGTPAELTLDEAWRKQGIKYFCFLSYLPTDLEKFSKRFTAEIRRTYKTPNTYYFFWIDNPDAMIINQTIKLRSSTNQSFADASFFLRNTTLKLGKGCTFEVNKNSDGIKISGPISIIPNISTKNEKTDSPNISTEQINLSLANDSQAIMQYNIKVNEDDLSNLDVGLRYFYSKNHLSNDIRSQRFPIFNLEIDKSLLALQVNIDPFALNNSNRTYYTFLKDSENMPKIKSYFRTDLGHVIYLTPSSNARLIFASKPALDQHDNSYYEPVYLVPAGQFSLTIEDVKGNKEKDEKQSTYMLLCGLSGTETIHIKSGNIMTFCPENAAYAPKFLAEHSIEGKKTDHVLLKDNYKTSWINIASTTLPKSREIFNSNEHIFINQYFSQPQSSSLYTTKAGISDYASNFLGLFQSRSADLHETENLRCYPLVPYAGVKNIEGSTDLNQEDISNFEYQIINPTRKKIIVDIGQSVQNHLKAAKVIQTQEGSGSILQATTPQGLIADIFVETDHWKNLLLAENTDKNKSYRLQFSNLTRELQDAFQTNQQFLIVTQNTRLGALQESINEPAGPVFNNTTSIEGFKFEINVGQKNRGKDFRNVMIFKFCNATVKELIKNPAIWTNACYFNKTENDGLIALSKWLQNYIDDAEKQNEFDASFNKFVGYINNPEWNGILILKVDVSLTDFPDELRALLAGIDQDRFNAHHLGIEVNFVEETNGRIKIAGKSSLFGLIYYLDKAYESQIITGGRTDLPVSVEPNIDYQFKVLSLKILFDNSEIKDFASKIQLTVNKWFDENVLKVTHEFDTAPSNSILLNGSLENHNGQQSYVFNTVQENKFWLSGNIYNYIEITKAQFDTSYIQEIDSKATFVKSRFNFFGFINFKVMKNFDALSFGSEPGNEKSDSEIGLNFSNLHIDMDFNIYTPRLKTFSFHPEEIRINIEQTTYRRHSLYAKFPLEYKGIRIGSADNLPSDQGYLPIKIQKLNKIDLSNKWYGIEYELNLGSPGALAASVGLLSKIIISWSPGSRKTDNSYKIFIGIKLPGVSGDSKLLSLQGILKLSIGDIQFISVPEENAFLLKLTKIALKLFILSFPPNGNTILFLFGNPNPDAPRGSLGWYAAYNKDEKKSEKKGERKLINK